jgi:hypothetical protein
MEATMAVTAVEGGHISSLDDTNRVIREIVEARNSSRESPSVAIASTEASPPENPKDTVGSSKLPIHLWPATATAAGCVALLNGALKYGRGNWREIGVRSSVYADACMRHVQAWFEGEECDEEGVPHLASALASLAILVDCEASGRLIDDRNYPGGFREYAEKLTKHVSRLRALHAGKSPVHYTISTPCGNRNVD